jgi:chemotaxis protein methyltransferase CheR
LQELRLADCRAYREYLEAHPAEWAALDGFCHIPVSRFLRERAVFDRLGTEIMPALAAAATARRATQLQCWSAGCASGEEPYSLTMIWELMLARRYPGLTLRVLATDVDEELLARARTGRYRRSSLREVPEEWRDAAFARCGESYLVSPALSAAVEFHQQDIRERLPPGLFDLILCRYVAFTYFDATLQRRTLERLLTRLQPGGALVIGLKEQLPADVPGVATWVPDLRIFRRTGANCGSGPE